MRYSEQEGISWVQEINQRVGQALRQLRQQRGWSLDQLAQACGVSKAMLGQIERGESSPTVVTLWKIAAGVGVPFSCFLQSSEMADLQAVYLGPPHSAQQLLGDGIRVTTLLPFEATLGYELLRVELPVGCEYHSVPHEPGSTEQVVPISGSLAVWLAGEWHELGEGQVLRFAGSQPHGYRNLGAEPVIFHDLIHYAAWRPVQDGSR